MKKVKAEKKPVPIVPASEKSARAVVKYLRISPRKVRLVIDVIRWKPAVQAFRDLMGLKKKAARMTEKILKTAVANARVLGMDESKLYVAEVRADGGPSLKRFMSRSMGRADRILKRTTHLTLIVKEGVKSYGKADTPFAAKAKKDKAEKASAKSS
ncbi:MAG: 50S ribosomal protein L22 [Candidatus Omnitrophica bacterium]|nr:50S ribosomal protein L22 [Candidatus Omnitrophota bacterium]